MNRTSFVGMQWEAGRSGLLLSSLLLTISFLLVAGCSTPEPAIVQNDSGTVKRTEQEADQTYRVRDLQISFLRKHPDQPPTSTLREASVRLKDTKKALVAPKTESVGGEWTLDELFRRPNVKSFNPENRTIAISRGALNRITEAMVEVLHDHGFIGVHVRPHPEDISRLGEDRRSSDDFDLRVLVHLAEVDRVRTIAWGDRYEGRDKKRNLPEHQWMREQSPVSGGTSKKTTDLLQKPLIDQYVYYLSRHQGRNVTASISDAGDGRAILDYNVMESKPWTVFAQVSNTGTENTDDLQERAGFIHRQLTGNDDIFRVDYTTAGFGEDMNDARLSYERPLYPGSPTRFKVNARYNEFTASDVGILGGDFEGETWGGGLALKQNVFQHDQWFLDVTVGGSWKRISTFNEITQVSVEEPFITPEVGLEVERFTQEANTTGSVSIKRNLDGVADTDETAIPALGRARTDADYMVANGNVSHSFFLEPVIYGSSWADPDTPDTSTRVHELRTSARGQYGFDNRVIPQESFIAGGMYSVRGYPESAASGDAGVVGSLEYRLHLPRLLPVESEPPKIFGSPFRFSPENVFGTPDWDFVLSGFFDYGRTTVNDRISGVEFDETLWSYGAGAELVFMRNLRLQTYYGRVGNGLDNGEADKGDDRVHFLLQVSY